jgi:ferritin-like metal-binding protein YciE
MPARKKAPKPASAEPGKAGKPRQAGSRERSTGERPVLLDLFMAELAEFIESTAQLPKLLQVIGGSASSKQLQRAVRLATEDAEDHAALARRIAESFPVAAPNHASAIMRALVTDTKRRATRITAGDSRDMLLITALQKAEHYDIVLLGTLAAWASALNAPGATRALDTMLGAKNIAERHLSRLAEEMIQTQGLAMREPGNRLTQRGGGNGSDHRFQNGN